MISSLEHREKREKLLASCNDSIDSAPFFLRELMKLQPGGVRTCSGPERRPGSPRGSARGPIKTAPREGRAGRSADRRGPGRPVPAASLPARRRGGGSPASLMARTTNWKRKPASFWRGQCRKGREVKGAEEKQKSSARSAQLVRSAVTRRRFQEAPRCRLRPFHATSSIYETRSKENLHSPHVLQSPERCLHRALWTAVPHHWESVVWGKRGLGRDFVSRDSGAINPVIPAAVKRNSVWTSKGKRVLPRMPSFAIKRFWTLITTFAQQPSNHSERVGLDHSRNELDVVLALFESSQQQSPHLADISFCNLV